MTDDNILKYSTDLGIGKVVDLTPNTISFYSGTPDYKEVLRMSKDGVWANPDVPADEAAKVVLGVLDSQIKHMVQKAVEAEREACAKVCEQIDTAAFGSERLAPNDCAAAIRARGNSA